MILWIILFLLVVAISFVLALLSMKDYRDIPRITKDEYGLFLIRQMANFNATTLERLGWQMSTEGLIISVERLFKGPQAALTIFGPRKIISEFIGSLNLLELEDYSQGLISSHVTIWEMGLKGVNHLSSDNPGSIFESLSQLSQEDQFFWQVVLGAKKIKGELAFQTQIRAVVYSQDPLRKNQLVSMLQSLNFGALSMVPKPFSTDQMMDFLKSRSLSSDTNGPILSPAEVINLLKV